MEQHDNTVTTDETFLGDTMAKRTDAEKVLSDIVMSIKKVNDDRLALGQCYIAEDETNEVIMGILSEHFLEELQDGVDIDDSGFLADMLGDSDIIREAEAGVY